MSKVKNNFDTFSSKVTSDTPAIKTSAGPLSGGEGESSVVFGKRIHLIGIGGIGMSGIARMFLLMGYAVQGSDLKETEILSDLERLGIRVFVGHDAAHLKDADLVVYSSSIDASHPELSFAVKNGLKILHRAEALAEICKGKYTIAVTGTHGKTTTTALIGMVLKEADRDPSIVVGGLVGSFGGNAYYGRGREIVIEADESDSSFLKFSPDLEVITNIEEEHMDHFETAEKIEAAYRDFVRRLPGDGLWLGCGEDPRIERLAAEKNRSVVLYGTKKKFGLYATDIVECPDGRRGVKFKAWRGAILLGEIQMKLIGRHNVLNALAALGAGLHLGVDFPVIARALGKYEGAGRRFDVRYEDKRFMIVDDYAHHPTEIQKTLAAAKALKKKRIVVLFQPHRYTRTAALMNEFGRSFFDADRLIVTDIYAAGENPVSPDVSGEKVLETIRSAGHKDVIFVKRSEVLQKVQNELLPGDLFIAMGAGDIYQITAELSDIFKSLDLFKNVRGRVIPGEPLSKHTTLKVGGPAKVWIEPESDEDLKNVLRICRENCLRILMFGAGSNLLPPDEGVKAVVLHLGASYFKKIWLEGERIVARAGALNSLFIQFMLEHGFGGCEFLLGIPGSIGGSIAVNAGSHKQSIDTYLESVRLLSSSGEEKILQKNEIPFGYRSSGLSDSVIVEGVFCLPACAREDSQKKLDEYRNYRAATQDLWHASAGCMFKNPLNSAYSSGKLIEDAGLKGRRIGNAQVSEKHANFIINLGGASARDVLSLIEEVQSTVKQKWGVELETEVKVI